MPDDPDPMAAKVSERAGGGDGSFGRELAPGETRTIYLRETKTGPVVKVITVYRTARDYVYDLVDAYNAARSRHDVIWMVDPVGQMRLVDADDWSRRNAKRIASRRETERAAHLRLSLEAARRARNEPEEGDLDED